MVKPTQIKNWQSKKYMWHESEDFTVTGYEYIKCDNENCKSSVKISMD